MLKPYTNLDEIMFKKCNKTNGPFGTTRKKKKIKIRSNINILLFKRATLFTQMLRIRKLYILL